MAVPHLSVTTKPALSVTADAIVFGVSSGESGPILHSGTLDAAELFGPAFSGLSAIGVSGTEDEVRRFPAQTGPARSIALVGLGAGAPTSNSLRRAAGAATRQLTGIETLAIALPAKTDEEVLAVLEGAAIGSYSFTKFRSTPPDTAKSQASTIIAVTPQKVAATIVSRAETVATAMHTVRDLVNTPPSHLYPETFADSVAELAKGLPVEVTVLAEDELAAGGYGGILGVGQGSVRGPRLVKVAYSPAGASKHVAFVGKGITFDSGGLSLKPAASMVGMKYDMTGAATVLATTLAIARLGLKVRATAWLCLAENLPSGSAVRPNDVLTIRGGKTVEVLNTDAEGRLVLADGLVAASEESPDVLVDVATLTGAARVALGNRYTGVMGDSEFVAELIEVADAVGEPMWHMPLPSELRALLNSDVADIANVKIGSTAAGMLIAGVFLQEFVGQASKDTTALKGTKIPWAHLDIAGPANNDGAGFGYTGKGPTAVAVRTLLALAERISLS